MILWKERIIIMMPSPQRKVGPPRPRHCVRRVEKECDTVKKCNGCTCVSYCDQKIQNKHREEHAKECMRIQKELDKARRQARSSITAPKEIGPLGKLPLTSTIQFRKLCSNREGIWNNALDHAKSIFGPIGNDTKQARALFVNDAVRLALAVSWSISGHRDYCALVMFAKMGTRALILLRLLAFPSHLLSG